MSRPGRSASGVGWRHTAPPWPAPPPWPGLGSGGARRLPEVVTEDAILHVEVDGEGPPVTVLAHGLTNSCRELAQSTRVLPASDVPVWCLGDRHASPPEREQSVDDLTRALNAVGPGDQ